MTISKFIYSTSFFLFLFTISGCTSMKPVEKGLTPEQLVTMINPGDKVIVQTKDSEKHLIVVETITNKKIEGSGKSFLFEDIIEIKKEGLDGWKTTGAVVGGAYIYSALIFLVLLGSL